MSHLGAYHVVNGADLEANDPAGNERDVEPPAILPERRAEAGQLPGSALVTRPASVPSVEQAADPASGFTRSVPSTREFLAFVRAEVERSAPHGSAREEELHAREAHVAADEERLDARELRVSRLEETLQWRLRELEDQERAYLEVTEQFQIRAAQDEDRLEQGMDNAVEWTRHEVTLKSEGVLQEKDRTIAPECESRLPYLPSNGARKLLDGGY